MSIRRLSFLLLAIFSSSTVTADLGADAQIPLQFSGTINVANATNCQRACLLMQNALAQETDFTVLPVAFPASYFSAQQQQLVPSCVVQPESAQQVSQALAVIKETECVFTVKSGGHSVATGASSIDGGIVIDLARLNRIQLSEDESSVFLGAGSKWRDVYLRLEERGLSTVGGRVGSVGVGGFTMGGGISFFSRRYGWAADNVRNFEVVLANGSIVNVNQKSDPELLFGLRGGGNNFGIVTGFDFPTHKQGEFFAGTNVFVLEDLEERRAALGITNEIQWTFDSLAKNAARWIQRVGCLAGFCVPSKDLIDAFVQLASDEQRDESAHAYIFFSWIPNIRAYLSGATIAYSKPVVNPPVFQKFTSFKKLSTTNRLANMSNFAYEIEEQNQPGARQAWEVATFKVDATLISKLFDIFISETAPLTKIPEVLLSFNLQLITKHETSLFSRNGGNSFGIEQDDGPLFLFGVTLFYKEANHDELFKSVLQKTVQKAIDVGKEMGLYHPFIYSNYASFDRGIAASRGPKNHQRLLQIQKKYDPDGVFQRLLPGFFKL